jgi:hypothetical protein
MHIDAWLAADSARTVADLAKRAGVSRDTIYNAVKRVPMTSFMAKIISLATKGAVTVSELESPENPVARKGWRCPECRVRRLAGQQTPVSDDVPRSRRAAAKKQR